MTGEWLIVAYVWGESFEWLKTVDVRKLISFNNAYCIRAYARGGGDPTGYQGAVWDMFYSLDRSGDSPPRSGTMHLENLLGIYLPPPDSQGISVTAVVQQMCLIMDTDWRQIIARPGEQTDW
ncbi:hypothetical protein HYQ44_011833 [Verticillium longisporum]|nr:hypothetical protein HYQ44_011833 [Verticillium longisporum]